MNMIGLVRESGGYGDIICTGAAAWAIKAEDSEEEVVSFVPEQFTSIASHLAGVDRVVSLGSLKDIQPHRRPRDSAFNSTEFPYLSPLLQYPEAHFVDLYCPGFANENSCGGQLQYNRCQLFAMAAGVRNILEARPEWTVTARERELYQRWRKMHELSANPLDVRLIAVQLRGTCAARSIPQSMRLPLVEALSEFGRVILFDCVPVSFEAPASAIQCIGQPLPLVAAILEQCATAVTVDSALWHLTAALGIPTVGIFGPTDGQVASQTYPFHTALDGYSSSCELACNYSRMKHWSRRCRETGCSRLRKHTVEDIASAVQDKLKKVKDV